jgi:hypothetical protein
MSHVLSRDKREQVIALGRLGWSLRRIEQATGVRRETASEYLRTAGIALRRPGGWGRHSPSKAAIDPITDSGIENSKPAINLITDSGGVEAKPAIEVITDFPSQKVGLWAGEQLRTLPGTDRLGTGTGPELDGDLAGPG